MSYGGLWRAVIGLCALLMSAVISACATSSKVPLTIHPMRALSTPDPKQVSFQGLEFLADPLPGQLKNRVNIVYIHGIGWTENPDSEQLADDFLHGIANAYGRQVEGQIIKTNCGKTGETVGTVSPHIFIKNPTPQKFETAIAGSTLTMDRLLCMDKQTLAVDQNLEFIVYRVFWDNLFWNGLQFAHVGQDDAQGKSREIANMRRKYNRQLKDELINYGISDAVMYLGPAGNSLRKAVNGALCSASLDAAGYDFAQQGPEIDHESICRLATNTSTRTNQFAFVSESLGSKILYDVLNGAMTDGRDSALDDMIAGSETYMLANQIPLLSLSDLNATPKAAPPDYAPTQRPKIIAMSEVNDFLTYELVPFFKQLWSRTSREEKAAKNPDDPRARRVMVDAIGFDIIDMRLEFADKIIPMLKSFVDPLQAHTGHAAEPELMQYVLCGARDGKRNDEGCLAAELAPKTKKKTRK